MAKVPYEPFATAQPQTPGEKLAVATPGAAFGENIGAALQHLGTTTDQVGNELFSRAIALQDLRDESDARAAQTEFATKSSELHAQYGALTGKEAADGLQPYIQAQQKLRDQLGANLAAPQARKYYDADSLPFMQRNVFSAAGHAADENKKFTIGTLEATADINVKATGDDPADDAAFADRKQKITDAITHATMMKAGTYDPDSPIVKDAVANAVSRQRAEQIIGIAKTDPFKATNLLDQHKTDLTEQDYIRASGVVETKGTAVGGVNIANQVFTDHRQPDGTYDVTTREMQDEIRQKAGELMPNNKVLPEVAVQKLDALINQDRYSQSRDVFDAKQTIAQAIGQGNVRDVQTLLAMPGMDKVVEKLPPRDKNDLQGYINRYNAAANKNTNNDNKVYLNGLAVNDVQKFLETDLTRFQLGTNDLITLQNKQAKLAKNPNDDPRVMRAEGWIRGAMGAQLQSLGIYKRDQNNADDYDHFTGALQEALQVWQEDHHAPPGYKDVIDTIGPEIMNRQTTKKGWLWNSQEPAFHEWNRPARGDVPPEFTRQITKDVIGKGGTAPTEEQLYQAYIRSQFIKLYGAPGGGSSPAKPQ